MKTVIVLVAVGIVILLVWWLKRKFTQVNTPQPQAPLHNIPQKITPEIKLASNETVAPEPVAEIVLPQVYEPVETKQEEQAVSPIIPDIVSKEAVPEDSILRRHYFSNLEAQRLAVTHPYPTDSTLRRHYESGLAWQLKPVTQVIISEPVAAVDEAESIISPDQSVSKWIIPEDSTLRRHFLTQIQAEVKTNL